MHKPGEGSLRIAFIASVSATDLLPAADVKPRYRGHEHPSPWVARLAAALCARGHTVAIFCHSRAVTREHCLAADGVTVRFIPMLEPIRLAPYMHFRMRRMALAGPIQSFSPDVTLAFGTETGNAVAIPKHAGTRIVFLQGIRALLGHYLSKTPWNRAVWNRLERIALRGADGIVAETTFAARWAMATEPGARVEVIPHMAPPPCPGATADYDNGPFLTVGSLVRHKGVDLVLRSYAAAAVKRPLEVIGDGAERMALERLANALGVAGRVTFTGSVPQKSIPERLATGSCLLLGSRMDNSPNVVTEAHAAGLPVIAMSTGGVPEMITEGRDGFLVPLEDTEAMAIRIRDLDGNPDRMKELGSRGRERVVQHQSAGIVSAAHEAFYRRCMAARSPGRGDNHA